MADLHPLQTDSDGAAGKNNNNNSKGPSSSSENNNKNSIKSEISFLSFFFLIPNFIVAIVQFNKTTLEICYHSIYLYKSEMIFMIAKSLL